MSTDNNTLQQRREKAQELADLGVKLYSNTFSPAHKITEVLPKGENLESQCHDEEKVEYSVAGRIMTMRKFGKAAFFHIMDRTEQVQIYIKKDVIGDETFAQFKKWDIGDIVGIKGTLFKTKVGELSIMASDVTMISKSLRPLPDKWHGLSDVETRYRQRYVDLIVNPDSREVFKKRAAIIRHIRDFLTDRGFTEVETPMMHTLPGGAAAKPFETYHNALDMPLYLRIAPELYLKRLLVGGLERVFEINRNFRNEGLSTRHNPEFTMLEFYQAYATYTELMDTTEEMVSTACEKVNGTMQITYQGTEVNLASPWTRMTMAESLTKVAGIPAELVNNDEEIIAFAKDRGIKLEATAGPGKARTELFELLVEEKLINPTFITGYPTEVSPLARRSDDNPEVTDRFELFITGRELANAFNELNDPVDQYNRFAAQIEGRGDDEEIHPELDHDYVRALEYGMPSAAGEGIGIDRLTMLLTDSPSIRDVIFFPHLKPEHKPQDSDKE